MRGTSVTLEGNEAVAAVAHALSEVIAISPITPSTPMGEFADAWSASGRPNLWGTVPLVIEMQSEGGASLCERTQEGSQPRVIGGRYGLSSKELTPAMVKGIFDELGTADPKQHFTIGINDDVTQSSLDYDPAFSIESGETVQCVFWGLGSDGTVGANKNSIKSIGEETEHYAQGSFVYDSKKSGSVTISHLRFGPHPIRAPYQIGTNEASLVACHQFSFLERLDVLKYAQPGGIFLLESGSGPQEVWDHLPAQVQQEIIEKRLHLDVIDAHTVARETGMGGRINTVMQTCFFALSGLVQLAFRGQRRVRPGHAPLAG